MIDRLTDQQISAVLSRALKTKNLIDKNDSSIIFHDLSFMKQKVHNLIELFPVDTLHAIPVKANPLQKILRKLEALGVGSEAASMPELHLAINAGFPSERIVFNSPTKTREELEYALMVGVHINADSLPELERIETILQGKQTQSTLGIRINPQVGTGTILSTSVAGDYSKFGVPLNEHRKELMDCYLRYNWLNGVHVHIGSQGCKVELLLNGIERVLGFVEEVNDFLRLSGIPRQINLIDIGGGLPVSYHSDQQAVSLSGYKTKLSQSFPKLFSARFKLITEFGRCMYVNAGWVASRVEYVKSGSVNTAMIHVGADLFLRECYNPQDWNHEIIVADSAGKLKIGLDDYKYIIAGPLCFAGDIIAREIELPRVEVGDFVIIKDTGAYTLGMWSRYNSRQIPKVIGYYEGGIEFETLKEREKIDDILRFWE